MHKCTTFQALVFFFSQSPVILTQSIFKFLKAGCAQRDVRLELQLASIFVPLLPHYSVKCEHIFLDMTSRLPEDIYIFIYNLISFANGTSMNLSF